MSDFPDIPEFEGKTEEEIIEEASMPLKRGEGEISYRKTLYALKYLEKGLERLKNYKSNAIIIVSYSKFRLRI